MQPRETNVPFLLIPVEKKSGQAITLVGATCSCEVLYPGGLVGTVLAMSPGGTDFIDTDGNTYLAGFYAIRFTTADDFQAPGAYLLTLVVNFPDGSIRKFDQVQIIVGPDSEAGISVAPLPVSTAPARWVLVSAIGSVTHAEYQDGTAIFDTTSHKGYVVVGGNPVGIVGS